MAGHQRHDAKREAEDHADAARKTVYAVDQVQRVDRRQKPKKSDQSAEMAHLELVAKQRQMRDPWTGKGDDRRGNQLPEQLGPAANLGIVIRQADYANQNRGNKQARQRLEILDLIDVVGQP